MVRRPVLALPMPEQGGSIEALDAFLTFRAGTNSS